MFRHWLKGDGFVFARWFTQGWANPGVILVHRFPIWTWIYSGLSPSTHKQRSPPPTPIHKHADQFPSTYKLWSLPLAPTHRSTSNQCQHQSLSLCIGLSMLVYLCIFVLICLCVCVCVSVLIWVYLCVSKEKANEERRSLRLSSFCTRRRERKKGAKLWN